MSNVTTEGPRETAMKARLVKKSCQSPFNPNILTDVVKRQLEDVIRASSLGITNDIPATPLIDSVYTQDRLFGSDFSIVLKFNSDEHDTARQNKTAQICAAYERENDKHGTFKVERVQGKDSFPHELFMQADNLHDLMLGVNSVAVRYGIEPISYNAHLKSLLYRRMQTQQQQTRGAEAQG